MSCESLYYNGDISYTDSHRQGEYLAGHEIPFRLTFKPSQRDWRRGTLMIERPPIRRLHEESVPRIRSRVPFLAADFAAMAAVYNAEGGQPYALSNGSGVDLRNENGSPIPRQWDIAAEELAYHTGGLAPDRWELCELNDDGIAELRQRASLYRAIGLPTRTLQPNTGAYSLHPVGVTLT